jgi:hypothetical protein
MSSTLAQLAGLSVPNTTYCLAGLPSLIPASGSSPVRSERRCRNLEVVKLKIAFVKVTQALHEVVQ